MEVQIIQWMEKNNLKKGNLSSEHLKPICVPCMESLWERLISRKSFQMQYVDMLKEMEDLASNLEERSIKIFN